MKKAEAAAARARGEASKAFGIDVETRFKAATALAAEEYRQNGKLVELIGALKQAEADRWEARKTQFEMERAEIRIGVDDVKLRDAQLATKNKEEAAARQAFIVRMNELDQKRTVDALAELQRKHQRELELYDLQARGYIEKQKALAQAETITHAEAQRRITAEQAAGFDKRRTLLEAEKEAAKGNAEQEAEIIHQLSVLKEQAALFKQEASGAATAAVGDDLDRLQEKINQINEAIDRMRGVGMGLSEGPVGNPKLPQGKGPVVAPDGTTPPELPFSGDIFQEWGTKVGEVFGVVKEQAQGVGEIISSSFGMMANAAGSAIKAFVLFGSAGGSFRKFAAEVIASVASMAIVQAVWEGAQALAMVALAWFTGNPKYLKSAAAHGAAALMYGAIGGVAAGAGRALAGSSFSEGGGGGGGAGNFGDVGGDREDYRTRYLREQAEKDKFTSREDRRGGERPIVVQLIADGRELARVAVDAIRDGHERERLASALRGAV